MVDIGHLLGRSLVLRSLTETAVDPNPRWRRFTRRLHPDVRSRRRSGKTRGVRDRLSSTAFAVAASAAALVVFALAFLAGRLTAPSSAATAPTLAPLPASRAAVTLPHLSQAVPLAGLRSAPAPVVRPAPAVRRVPAVRPAQAVAPPRVHRSKPKKRGAPVDIVGSG